MTGRFNILRFVCVGSINFDVIFQASRLPQEHEKLRAQDATLCCGGSAANTAYWLARFGHNVSMVGCVGKDELGRSGIESLRIVGVDTSCIQMSNKATTGVATVLVNANSKRMITYAGANTELDLTKLDPSAFHKGVHIHVASADDRRVIPFLNAVRLRGVTVSCEFNGLQSEERARCCDIAFMNHDELRRWTTAWPPWNWWRSISSAWLVLTKGKEGAQAYCDNVTYQAAAVPTDVLDRTGGGDAFNAGFLSGIAKGASIENALSRGLWLASLVIRYPGSRPAELNDCMLRSMLNS
jgi:sugar/nucleoside kinase (ribokinase family)